MEYIVKLKPPREKVILRLPLQVVKNGWCSCRTANQPSSRDGSRSPWNDLFETVGRVMQRYRNIRQSFDQH